MNIQLGDRNFVPQRIFCIGRNYVAHAHELNSDVPSEPVIFMKPPTCLQPEGGPFAFPEEAELHYESELVILIGKEGRPETIAEARTYVAGMTLGLDLTLRDLQQKLVAKALPWERCKAFDGSAPIGQFTKVAPDLDLSAITFEGHINNEVRQQGDTSLMIFPVEQLLLALATHWKLLPGDLLFTGTPVGVGQLHPGDIITLSSPLIGSFNWTA